MCGAILAGDTVRVSLTEDPEFELVPCSTLIRWTQIQWKITITCNLLHFMINWLEGSSIVNFLLTNFLFSFLHHLSFLSDVLVLVLRCYQMTLSTQLSLPGLRARGTSWSSTRGRETCLHSKRVTPWTSEVLQWWCIYFTCLVILCCLLIVLLTSKAEVLPYSTSR